MSFNREQDAATVAQREWAKLNTSIIFETFWGLSRTQTICSHQTCDHKGTPSHEPFLELGLNMPQHDKPCSLSELIREIEEPVHLGEAKCDKCKRKNTLYSQLTLVRLPPVLILRLIRFHGQGEGLAKKDNRVDFDDTLDSRHIARHGSLGRQRYKLNSVLNHAGTRLSGHNWAYCHSEQLGCWHNLNDELVTKINRADFRREKAYMFVYHAVEAEEEIGQVANPMRGMLNPPSRNVSFFNSIFQCLASIDRASANVSHPGQFAWPETPSDMLGDVTRAFKQLLRSLKDDGGQECPVNPLETKKALSRHIPICDGDEPQGHFHKKLEQIMRADRCKH